jgi:hypothetical protein
MELILSRDNLLSLPPPFSIRNDYGNVIVLEYDMTNPEARFIVMEKEKLEKYKDKKIEIIFGAYQPSGEERFTLRTIGMKGLFMGSTKEKEMTVRLSGMLQEYYGVDFETAPRYNWREKKAEIEAFLTHTSLEYSGIPLTFRTPAEGEYIEAAYGEPLFIWFLSTRGEQKIYKTIYLTAKGNYRMGDNDAVKTIEEAFEQFKKELNKHRLNLLMT